MTTQLPLPKHWHWSDYDKPTIRSDNGDSCMDGTIGEKYRVRGGVPCSARLSFFARRMQLRQVKTDEADYTDALSECSDYERLPIESHTKALTDALEASHGIIVELLDIIIQMEEEHENTHTP